MPGVAGTWKALTDSVNFMAGNLTAQVRNIAEVTTAVARGDLSRKITVDVKGEILELKNTINTMVDQLNAFASEVTRVARDVGTEGKLGGQAEVSGVAGTPARSVRRPVVAAAPWLSLDWLLGHVPRHECCVGPAPLEQLVVRAPFDDRSLIEHDNLVGVADGREPVRDRQRGASLREALELGLHGGLGLGVE